MKDKINAIVYCRNNEYGKLDFYLKVRENSMYLFTTDFYSHCIHDEYYNGKDWMKCSVRHLWFVSRS